MNFLAPTALSSMKVRYSIVAWSLHSQEQGGVLRGVSAPKRPWKRAHLSRKMPR